MEQLLQQLSELSTGLIEQLDSCTTEDIELYMEQRDRLFAALQAVATEGVPTSSAAQELVTAIRSQDATITARMMELRREAAVELGRINQGKRSRQAYDAYGGNDDGVFFDTRH